VPDLFEGHWFSAAHSSRAAADPRACNLANSRAAAAPGQRFGNSSPGKAGSTHGNRRQACTSSTVALRASRRPGPPNSARKVWYRCSITPRSHACCAIAVAVATL
jgi:hypothetical protein